jgi:hypothetical protein
MAERPEDLNLPTSIVTKIIKDCLPSSCKVSKEANAAITKVGKFLFSVRIRIFGLVYICISVQKRKKIMPIGNLPQKVVT